MDHPTTVYFLFPGDLHTATGGYHYDRRLIGELEALGLDVRLLPLSPRYPYPDTAARQHAQQALAGLPDGAIVLCDGLAFGVMDGIAVAEARRLRLIALCHHPLAEESGLDAEQQKRFQTSEIRALQCTRAVVVTSTHTARLLSSHYAVPQQRITVAPPGTDPRPFATGNGQPLQLLTVATLTPRKAHDVLIEALAALRDLSWQARFVGGDAFDPAWTAELKRQVNRHQLQQRICFTGQVDDLQSEYEQADLFVLPSRFEGYGMVFAEALAAGLPVIAARSGAVPDVVPPDAGRLVAVDDVAALAGTLRQLITDKALREQLQAGARQAARALPSWRDSADRVAKLIGEVAQT